ncbi:MAG: DUF4440 domain-containing protein [Tatlockia sp.]|nr:DUF4440 domain-containing protein [Tatlockia sp.]
MSGVVELLIKQEKQLLDNIETSEILAELIDNEFVELASSGAIHDKAEVIRWLNHRDQAIRFGSSFKAQKLAESIILLTYISSIKDTPSSETKKALRSSIWRLTEGKWRMVFHQGTPMKTKEAV